jgi:hypothetical protein
MHQTARVSSFQLHDSNDIESQYINDSINKQKEIESTEPDSKRSTKNEIRLIQPKKIMYNACLSHRMINISGKSVTINSADWPV